MVNICSKFYFYYMCRWAKLINTLVDFLVRMSAVAMQLYQIEDSLDVTQFACRIDEVQEEEDDMFIGYLKVLMLMGT